MSQEQIKTEYSVEKKVMEISGCKKKDLEKQIRFEAYENKTFLLTYNTLRFLIDNCDIDDYTEELDKEFSSFASRRDNYYRAWDEVIIKFLESKGIKFEYSNTANYSTGTILSEDIEVFEFTHEDSHYACIRINRRTQPRFFRIHELDYFYMAMLEFYLGCDCTLLHSYDGYNLHDDFDDEFMIKSIPDYWIVKRNKFYCTKCERYVCASVLEY